MVAINAKVIHRFGVSDISLYILCIPSMGLVGFSVIPGKGDLIKVAH